MRATELKKIGLLLTVVVFSHLHVLAQTQFDTEPPSSGDLKTRLETADVFDRSKKHFDLGLNFSNIKSKVGNEFFGLSIFDDNIYADTGTTAAKLARMPNGSRVIAVNAQRHPILYGVGHGMMTRVDPEIEIDSSTGHPEIETGTNTGAVHMFANSVPAGTGNHYVSLTPSTIVSPDISFVFSGNSNNDIWRIDPRDRSKITKTVGGVTTSYFDPMRTGEFMVVSISLFVVSSPASSFPGMDVREFDPPVVVLS